EGVLSRLKTQDQIVLRYTLPPGIDPGAQEVPYPHDPNGSVDHIAGICDPTGRILGLMPHPERHVHPSSHPRWTREGLSETPDGLRFFTRAVQYVERTF
ncbi:MAG: phosphoribosylformylglycinamidine synthase subunit PurQ, partial [Planctomycetota bacterium]|nr:phosphoribosylformylglycinamidine synthase subunit PurQ [Planctomycetota bacterium]